MSDMTPMGAPPTPPPPAETALPWEEPNAGLGSIFSTLGGFVTRPIESFGRMSLTIDLVRPLAFYVALLLFGAVLNQTWDQVFWSSTMGMLRHLLESSGQGAMWGQLAPFLARPNPFKIALGLVVTPLIWLVILFAWTAVVHGVLALVGGGKNGFAATLRVMCYSGTAWVAATIPLFGSIVVFVWYLVLAMIGLASAQRAEGWKVALAILLPLALCCLCCVGGAAFFGAAISQAIQQRT